MGVYMNISKFINDFDIYKETYRLYHYRDDVFRLVYFNKREIGYEKKLINPVSDGYNVYDLAEYKYDTPFFIGNKYEVNRISLSRTKRKIKEICLCNDFKYFVTLTVSADNADRYSLKECQGMLQRLIKNYSMRFSRRNLKFNYILITEKHKDGAFHFHGLFSDLLKNDLYTNKFGYISSHFFDEQLGFCSFSEIKDIVKCSNYITKYITKDCIRNEHNQIYICSKGLKHPDVYDVSLSNMSKEFFNNIFFWSYRNEYCKLKDFRYSELCDNDKLFLYENFKKES